MMRFLMEKTFFNGLLFLMAFFFVFGPMVAEACVGEESLPETAGRNVGDFLFEGEQSEAPALVCTSQCSTDVANAVTGVMDMETTVMATTAIGAAAQAGAAASKDEDTAKDIVMADAGVKTGLGLLLAIQWEDCRGKLSTCRSACGDGHKDCHVTGVENAGLPGTKTPTCADILAECESFANQCAQIGIQAAIAGAQGVTSYYQAQGMGDDGGGGDTTKSSPLRPPSPTKASSAGVSNPSKGTNIENLPSTIADPTGSNDEGSGSPYNQEKASAKDSSSPSGSVSRFAGPSSSPSSSTGSGGFNKGNALAGSQARLNSDEEEDEEEIDLERESISFPRSSSQFTGSASRTPSQKRNAPGTGGRGGKGNRSPSSNKGDKIASNNLKRDIFKGSSGSRSIFESMTQTIRSFCSEDTERCK